MNTTTQILKKNISLGHGALELSILGDGKLILGELIRGTTTRMELKIVLTEEGYGNGIIDDNIEELAGGLRGQIPVAAAFSEDEPATVKVHFENDLHEIIRMDHLDKSLFDRLDFSSLVKTNDTLLSVIQPAQTYLIYPDGKKISQKKLPPENIISYAGENTHAVPHIQVILADIDGSAHRSVYGDVSVHPVEKLRSIGRMHGKVNLKTGLQLEEDIQKDSSLKVSSNLIVRGLIKSSFVQAEGNIQCDFGIDNSLKHGNATIIAGQTLLTASIRKYEVWSGSFVIAKNYIDRCQIQCMNSVIAPQISGSEIRVGNKLYANTIDQKTHVFLGPSFVENPRLREKKRQYQQHEKRLYDLNSMIEKDQFLLELNRSKVIQQIQKLREQPEVDFSANLVLKRFYDTLNTGLLNLKQKNENYRQILDMVERERREILFYERQLRREYQPEVIVFGRLESGTVIVAPNETLKVRETLRNVSIKLDELRGILKVTPLNPTG